MKKYFLAVIIAFIVMYNPNAARAAEVTLIGPGGIRAAATQLIADFEKATGHKVKATFGSGGGTKQQVIKGEPFDVPIVQLPLQPVIASGHVIAAAKPCSPVWPWESPCAAVR
jgi:molybdate transport system substrate-binding protein